MQNKPKQTSPERNKETRKIVWNGIYILLTIGIIAAFGLLDRNVGNFFAQIKDLKLQWILAAAGITLLFWFFEGELVHYITSFLFKGYDRRKTFKIGMIGVYYSALTPFSSGGQPMQVMHMKKDGVPVGKSSCMFCVKFIIFEFVICGFFILNLIFAGTQFFARYHEVFWFTCIGFAVNAVLALIVILALFSKGKMLILGTRLMHFLHRLHLVKNPEKRIVSLAETLDDFSESGVLLRSNLKLLIGSITLTAIEMFTQFSVTYCVYRSMGLSAYSLLDVVSMQAYLYLTVSFVPLPGGIRGERGWVLPILRHVFPEQQDVHRNADLAVLYLLRQHHFRRGVCGVRFGARYHGQAAYAEKRVITKK